jgi:phosphopantetheinyl transferase (holo-ACP synthase)
MNKIIGIGVDLISKNHHSFNDDRIISKYMCDEEISAYSMINNPEDKLIYKASLWVIKEAVYKALDVKVGMRSIVVKKIANDSPYCQIKDSDCKVMVSLSYSENIVIASVIITK